MPDTVPLLDLLIVGAGISGISAACHLHRQCPGKSYQILEARDAIGGTWDLFRYPGIRSDSDMHTFGFAFKPWSDPKALADGPAIKAYLQEAVDEYGVAQHIRFGQKVTQARWQDDESQWQVLAEDREGRPHHYRTRVLFLCSGYYNYEHGFNPELPGIGDFQGPVIHPQFWPEDLDFADRRLAVIGSGATAVTLVPALAERAAQVSMIQRSPSYVVSRPGVDRLAQLLNRLLPERLAYRLIRARNIWFQNAIYRRSRSRPDKLRQYLLRLNRKELGDDYPVERDFAPSYNPWDQRLCLVPDADLFKAIKSGKARVVTGLIDRITAQGVLMQSGELVEADILITATGLELKLFGGVAFYLGDEKIDFSRRFSFHGMMVSGVPNLVWTFGYINASWTLRADLNSRFVCEMFQHLDRTGTTRFQPCLGKGEESMAAEPWVTDFNPGYMKRGLHLFPQQGDHLPWRNTQNYLLDRKLLGKGLLDDGVLQFS
ncbi:MAG: NAD(P)/FAD-dependent oxidoreductase [Gammaproteobacteria bacterium]|nr:NAD(P)/FAD-dependent oxidoreductase [Pseudomonadales bacterium]